jgi:hypothetical protein
MSRSKPVPNARAASAALRREIQARAVAPPAPRMAGNRLNSAWSQADRALGGWLPGGGVANPLSGTVRAATDWKRAATLQDVKQQAVSSGSAGDALGFLGVPVLGAAAQGIQKLIKPLASRGTTPSLNTYVNRASAQQRVVQSADQYLGRMGSGVLPYAMATGTSKVPVSAMIDIGEASSTGPIGPHYRPENLGTKGTVNVFSNSTPGWVIAHEFGHAADHVKRPKAWMDFNQMSKFSEAQERRFINNARGRMLSPGAIVSSAAFAGGGDRKRSVLEAGVEGGFLGIAANWDLLSKEVLADVHGRRIARNAGVPWNERQNFAAKSSYVLGTGGTGFIQGIAGEVAARAGDFAVKNFNDAVMDPAMRVLRGGPSRTEKSLEQYGYNPNEHVLEGGPGQSMRIRPRTHAGRFVNNFAIPNP